MRHRTGQVDALEVLSDVRFGSRPCENSEIQIACRNSVLVSLILEINCTDGLCREKAIENIFLLVLGFRSFSHSLGQNRKSSIPALGHYQPQPGLLRGPHRRLVERLIYVNTRSVDRVTTAQS